MHDVSVGQADGRDDNENEVQKDRTLNKTFGEEGTNKTQPKPNPHAKPSDVPSGGKHIEPSPFTRR
ncbi:hypothetical protein [Polaromonas sp.]|uniref:hypothetical protein n=1 Tax=Polaromonas sp. TaxID=1869339 RepID=UPI003C948DBE